MIGLNKDITSPKRVKQHLEVLAKHAIKLGASDSTVIISSKIVVDNKLADLCKNDQRCKNYGTSLSCPPNVPGPSSFKKWQKDSKHSIVVRIDLPTEVALSKERLEVMKLLHQIVATVEQKATETGYQRSRSFAGGSCKEIFCYNHTTCNVITNQAQCRNKEVARPSMSGLGINVIELMRTAGWSANAIEYGFGTEQKTTWFAGLILISGKSG